MSAPAGAPRGLGVYQASPDRYVALALFSSVAFLIAGTWLSLAPITDLAALRYDVSAGAVDQVRPRGPPRSYVGNENAPRRAALTPPLARTQMALLFWCATTARSSCAPPSA